MQSGQLRRRITIQQPSTTKDSFGQPTQDWADWITTWAGIRAATSKDVYAASGFTTQVSHVITVRYRLGSPILSSYRIVYEGRIFHIQAIADPDESRRQLNLLCLEIVNGAQ